MNYDRRDVDPPDPHVCEHCKEEGVTPGEDCQFCHEYVMTDSDYAEIKAEMRAEQMRDGLFFDDDREVW